MIKKLTVAGKMIDLRSDHLLAVVAYAYEQAASSDIDVLDFGANENDLNSDEQLEYLQHMLTSLQRLTAGGNQDLLIVAADDEQLTKYHRS
jgi:deoxyribodipyrimidine photolyase